MDLCIIGSGYVGLVSGACFAEVGHHVVCVDNDQRKVDMLQRGEIPIYEPGLEDLVHRNVSAKRLRFTNSIEDGVDHSQVIFIAVPTPPQADGSVDLTYIEKVAREIAGVRLSLSDMVTGETLDDRLEKLTTVIERLSDQVALLTTSESAERAITSSTSSTVSDAN